MPVLVRIIPCLCLLFVFCSYNEAAETYFEVVDNEGKVLIGTIAGLNRTQIIIDVQGASQTIPLEKLVTIRNTAPNPYPQESSASAASLELKDGTRLTAASFTATKDQCICRLWEQPDELHIPLDAVAAVRFNLRKPADALTPPEDWQRLAKLNADGDKLIVGNPGSFDVYNGILQEVSESVIFFAVDGEILPVPKQKVFGLVFHGENVGENTGRTAEIPPDLPQATLTLWTGTQAMFSDIHLVDERLTWHTATGLTMSAPLMLMWEIVFSEKGTAYLTDFERTRSEFSISFVPEITPSLETFIQTFYESRSKASSGEYIVDGIAYRRAVTLRGETSLEYRLPRQFTSFKALVGIEDQYRPYVGGTLQIYADSQLLGFWEVRGDSAAQRIQLTIPPHCRTLVFRSVPASLPGTAAVLTIAEPKLFE